jgi:hypothetical protein
MNFIRLDRDVSLAEVAGRAYQIEGRGAAARVVAAEAALAKANPHLADRAVLTKGTLIAVPTVPGLTVSDQVEGLSKVGAALVKDLAHSLDETRATLRVTTQAARDAAEETVKLAKGREFKALIKRLAPAAEPLVADAAANAKEEAEQAQAQGKALDAAWSRIAKDLSEFDDQLKR